MEKEFIPYELALELKELGFDEPCLGAYGAWGFMSSNDVNSLSDEVTQEDLDNQGYNEEDGVCLAPLYQQAFRWFREKYQLHFSIMVQHGGTWYFERFSTKGFKTYEEAELACLKHLIKIINEKD